MNKVVIIFMLFSLIIIAGCPREVHETHEYYEVDPNVKSGPGVQNKLQPSVTPTQPKPQVQPTNPVIEPQEQPAVQPKPSTPSWMNQKIQATGQCAINPAYSNNPGRAKLMALRGAQLDALRNLLERVLGLQLDSQTVVKDMVTEKDQINAQTSGFVRGAYKINQSFDGSIATVTMELKLYNVYRYLKTNKIY